MLVVIAFHPAAIEDDYNRLVFNLRASNLTRVRG
jgi:hypothetical protein